MKVYSLRENYLYLLFIVFFCASLTAAEPEKTQPWYEVISQNALPLFKTYVREKKFVEAYKLASTMIFYLRETPAAVRETPAAVFWYDSRLRLFNQKLSSTTSDYDTSKYAAAIDDSKALLHASSHLTIANLLSMDSLYVALNLLQSHARAFNTTSFNALEQCLQSPEKNPLLRFIACNHCLTLALKEIPEAKERASQYFKICPFLATKALTLPLFGDLDKDFQNALLKSFIDNASMYLQRKMTGTLKISPDSQEMITYRDLILLTLSKINGKFEVSSEEYGMQILAPIYDAASNKEAICTFLFPLMQSLLEKSELEQPKNRLVKNSTHNIFLQLMGLSYFHGAGVTKDYKKAASYLQRTIDRKDFVILPDAMFAYSFMQMNGHGCEKNLAAAETGFQRLVSHPDKKSAAHALYQLGVIKFSQSSYGPASIYFTDATNLLKSMLDAHPCDEPQRKMLTSLLVSTIHGLATTAHVSKGYEAAVSNFTQLAALDCSDIPIPACIEMDYLILGDLHARGLGTPRCAQEALKWYQKVTPSSDHEHQQRALVKIVHHLGNPRVQSEQICRMIRWSKYTIGAVYLPAYEQGWPPLTNIGTVDYEVAIARMAELTLHLPQRTTEDLDFAGIYFSRLSTICRSILHRKDDSPEQAAEIAPHLPKLQQLLVAARLGLGETYYQQQRYQEAQRMFARVAKSDNTDFKNFALLRTGDLCLQENTKDSLEQASTCYTTLASQNSDMPCKKAAKERLEKMKE